ncbi:MAG: ATP-dependent Clp protease ATP-binding subunit [bacterium]
MFIIDYFLWHYLQAPKRILQIWGNFLRFFIFYFIPVPQLLRTLLSPWKRDVTGYGKGFDFKKFFETFAFNLVSRFLGAVVRTIVIALALVLEIFAVAGGFLFLLFWLFWPFFLVGSLVYTIYLLFQPGMAKIASIGLVGFDIATIFVFLLFYRIAKQRAPSELSLKEIFEQPWADIVCERLGLQKQQIPQNVLQEPEKFLDEFLKQISLPKKDFSTFLEWQIMTQDEIQRKKRFWEKENLFNSGGIGRSWIYGWTNTLDQFSHPLQEFRGSLHLVGRQNELKAMERILCKQQQSNVLIVGEPGVGKMTFVRQFAKLISEGKIASPLAFRRVIEVDLNSALSGLTSAGQIEERLIRLFNEAAAAGNVILIVNDFHNFVSEERNISPILTPFIEGSYFQLIALTTYQNLHEEIEKNPGLLKFFEKIEIKEPGLDETFLIMLDNMIDLEKRAGRRITLQALKEVIKTSDQYISDVPMPEKAMDLLEETTLYVAGSTKEYFVSPAHVDLVISQKTEIPVGQLQAAEKEKLLNLEEFIHARVVGQDIAVKEIASAMRRARLEVASKNRPMGSFLFLGPTGVGKTETAKALAEAYFGSDTRMLRFDMSEYQGAAATERILGSALTEAPGILTTAVRENPFSLLLLDEIEKADTNVLNLFLQVLDEGWLTDAFGRKVNFRNLIIIATSNAATELIRETVQQGSDPNSSKQKILDYIQQQGIFKPEFLNRFDGVVLFHPLSQEDILKIARLQLDALAKRLATQEIIFNSGEALAEKIARLGYDPNFGARAMKRVIQDKIEDLIAKKMLKGEIQKQVPFEIKSEEID